jgi:hypothetical protein|tara:strand:+ start:12714 stop:13028 length:315 start_codon:yes stop_codon:yes gene_type:complete
MRKTITTGQRFKSIKKGISTASKYPDRPMREAEKISLMERAERHSNAHPNDKNTPKENKGVQWAKSKKTERDKKLKEFYKTHVYTWVSETNRAWVAIPSMEEEE